MIDWNSDKTWIICCLLVATLIGFVVLGVVELIFTLYNLIPIGGRILIFGLIFLQVYCYGERILFEEEDEENE